MLRKLLRLWYRFDAWWMMRKVNADPRYKDVKAPEYLHDKVMEEIRKLR